MKLILSNSGFNHGLTAIAVSLLTVTTVFFSACGKQEPFDTQSPDDAPLILKPYNESGTGSFTYDLANPDTPLFDSVTVTPSAYTTVNWYLDGQRIHTGLKINMCFPAGSYALTIEALTAAGKRTGRTGSVTVHPYSFNPYSAAPAAGRHAVPGMEVELEGQNLGGVTKVILSDDLFGENELLSLTPSAKADASLRFVLPEMGEGTYYLRLQDAEGNVYGADDINVHNGAVALSGFAEFVPLKEWTITGVSLQNVVSVKVDANVITELAVTGTSVTFTAPEAEVGEHTLSMQNNDGSAVLFITADGSMTEVTAVVSAETTVWEGPGTLDWNAELVKTTSDIMAAVPVGSTVFVYFDIPEAEYHAMRITTPWWGDSPEVDDIITQFDVTGETPNPFAFEYDARRKALVDERGAMSIVGFGVTINRITFK